MPPPIELRVSTLGLNEASAEIERIAREKIIPTASLIDEAFAEAASSIETSLSSAALSGENAFKTLAQSVLKDLRRLAIDTFVRKPIESLFTNAFGGARAFGGPVARGGAYLVGERGPELFTPGASGAVHPLSSPSMTVNITLPGVTDAQSFRQSETQIAAALARAVGRGRRNL